jgi:mannose-6-phosphate isomerase class I
MKTLFRDTKQFVMPAVKPVSESDRYNIYPSFSIGDGKIFRGVDSLTEIIEGKRIVIIDGYEGVFFETLRKEISELLMKKHNIDADWINASAFFKPENEINILVEPFLGGKDPIFGTRTNLSLIDFFDKEKLSVLSAKVFQSLTIIYGIGASLLVDDGFLIYADLPKNEIQFRSRAGSVTNLGAMKSTDSKSMYKRFYFVDWIVLNEHKRTILEKIDLLADCQRHDDITWIHSHDLNEALHMMSMNVLRARPWFEPGTWGGTWIKNNIDGLNKDVINYAWSFECIVPENGLVLESSDILLEFSFDTLMFSEAKAILGDCYDRYGTEFPIRFDFLDTIDGGNLSVQCHPDKAYTRSHFGENFTQEETYYILDCKNDAVVYLGFSENIDETEFSNTLINSFLDNIPVTIEDFVQKHPASKHDLFLIPPGTIHGSGKDNLVLEISSTPYIFTFKLYDWLRPDLDGKPRPLNIERGMANLRFDMKGDKVKRELISVPALIEKGADWELYHLPTHPDHLYDVHRYIFTTAVDIQTENKCHVLSLVEGESIAVRTGNGLLQHFSYAETFIIPAAAGKYTLINESNRPAMVVKAFVK